MADDVTNPFRFGALALDDTFADREAEIAELVADARNGQDVVVFAPRRYGKSSLVWRVARQLVEEGVLVAQVDLMTTPTKARLADKLARTIYEDVASPLFRARERLRVFQGLRITPTVTVDPSDGTLSFSFDAGRRGTDDVDATLERLLQLPGQLAADRNRRVVLVLDEFQEVADIDPALPRLMRAVFQEQPDVAHLYLGSRRHLLERIFEDRNEPFWRSAKRLELGVIPPPLFAEHIERQFDRTGRAAPPGVVSALLEITHGHPYATQELSYFLWEATPAGEPATPARLEEALAAVLRAENSHFGLVWEQAAVTQRLVLQALAEEPGRPLAEEYRRRHGLPGPSSVQRALQALTWNELVAREDGVWHIVEPFLAEWLRRA